MRGMVRRRRSGGGYQFNDNPKYDSWRKTLGQSLENFALIQIATKYSLKCPACGHNRSRIFG
jgi:hypothetical protein